MPVPIVQDATATRQHKEGEGMKANDYPWLLLALAGTVLVIAFAQTTPDGCTTDADCHAKYPGRCAETQPYCLEPQP
jgi:hypothetical protein